VVQGQFSDPDFISGTQQRENVQFANNNNDMPVDCLYINYNLMADIICNKFVNIYDMFSRNEECNKVTQSPS
jgi:hypothetical protein